MKEILQQFKQNYLIKYWNPVAAVIAAGLISAYYFGVTGTYWAVTGEFTRWGGHALQVLGVDVSDWSYYKIIGMQGTIFTRIDGVMILGTVSYTHLRAHETRRHLVCRLLLEKKK